MLFTNQKAFNTFIYLCERFEQVGRDQCLNVWVAVDGAVGAQVGAKERQQAGRFDVGRLGADLRKRKGVYGKIQRKGGGAGEKCVGK